MGDCPIARSAGVSRQGREAHSSAATTFGRASPSAVAEQANSALEPTALRAAAQRPESLYGPTERSRLMTSKIIGIELRFDGDGTVRQVGQGGFSGGISPPTLDSKGLG